MNDIKERYEAINRSDKKNRLDKYSSFMNAGYSPNEIFNKINDLTVEEAFVYYHLCREESK